MKKLFAAAVASLVFAAAAAAQSAPAPAAPAPAAETPAPAAAAPAAQPPAPAAPEPAQTVEGLAAAAPAPQKSFLQQELEAAGSEISAGQLGAMTYEDFEKVLEHVAIAAQKEKYVERIRDASFAFPGAGQFMAGDALGGWLFVAWDVTVLAGTIVSAYFVLPANVQLASLDYAGSSLSAIITAWQSNSIVAYVPFMAVVAGGVILETILRYVSADNAAKMARKNIDEGKVTFQPTLDVAGGLGVGLKMTY